MATIFYDEMWMNDLGTKLQKHSSLPVRNDGEGRAGGGGGASPPCPPAPPAHVRIPRVPVETRGVRGCPQHTKDLLGFLTLRRRP